MKIYSFFVTFINILISDVNKAWFVYLFFIKEITLEIKK